MQYSNMLKTLVLLMAIFCTTEYVTAKEETEPVLSTKLKNIDMQKIMGNISNYLPDFNTGYELLDVALQTLSFLGVFTLAYAMYMMLYPVTTTMAKRSTSNPFGIREDMLQVLNLIEKFDVEKMTAQYLEVKDPRCQKRIACEIRYNLGRNVFVKVFLRAILGINGKSPDLIPETINECIFRHTNCTTSLVDVILRRSMRAFGSK